MTIPAFNKEINVYRDCRAEAIVREVLCENPYEYGKRQSQSEVIFRKSVSVANLGQSTGFATKSGSLSGDNAFPWAVSRMKS